MLMRVVRRLRPAPPQQRASAGIPAAYRASPEDEVSDAASAERAFVRQIWHMRVLGFGLGALPVAAVLYETRASVVTWALMLLTGYAWPHVAAWISRRSPSPREAEFRSMGMDSILGGAWVAVIGFNLVPSALLLTMLTMDKVGVAGWRFLVPTSALLMASCLVTSALLGYHAAPHSSTLVVAASLPLLFAFPVAMSHVLYRVTRKVISQNRQLALLNRSDMLTGLPNRRHWQEAISHELGRFFRTGRPAVVMLIDVDNFKEVNDRHGHAVGDDVLRTIAGVLRSSVRDMDTAVRYGGDEFAVLATETEAPRAREHALRKAHALAKRP
jgi:diguanylate cyclase